MAANLFDTSARSTQNHIYLVTLRGEGAYTSRGHTLRAYVSLIDANNVVRALACTYQGPYATWQESVDGKGCLTLKADDCYGNKVEAAVEQMALSPSGNMARIQRVGSGRLGWSDGRYRELVEGADGCWREV